MGQLAIGIGDLGLAYQAFKIAVSVDMNHAESFNNLGVLELRKHNPEAARSNFEGSHKLSEFHFGPLLPVHTSHACISPPIGKATTEGAVCTRACIVVSFLDLLLWHSLPFRKYSEPLFNAALLSFKLGDFQQSFDQVSKAIALYPDHNESQVRVVPWGRVSLCWLSFGV